MRSGWLFSFKDQALLARCPRHLSGHPYRQPCYGQLAAVKKSIR